MLTDPFPNQETNLVSKDPTSSNLVLMLSSTKPKNDILVATQSKDYGNVNPSNGETIDQPTNLITSPSDSAPNFVPTKLKIKPPKGVNQKLTFNPCTRAAKNL